MDYIKLLLTGLNIANSLKVTYILIKYLENFESRHAISLLQQILKIFTYLPLVSNYHACFLSFFFFFLAHYFPLLKLPKDNILIFQDIYLNISRVIINNGQYVFSTAIRYNLKKGLKVVMNVSKLPLILSIIVLNLTLHCFQIHNTHKNQVLLLSPRQILFIQDCKPSLTCMPKVPIT